MANLPHTWCSTIARHRCVNPRPLLTPLSFLSSGPDLCSSRRRERKPLIAGQALISPTPSHLGSVGVRPQRRHPNAALLRTPGATSGPPRTVAGSFSFVSDDIVHLPSNHTTLALIYGHANMHELLYHPITSPKPHSRARNVRNRALPPDRKKGHRGAFANKLESWIILTAKIAKHVLDVVSYAIAQLLHVASVKLASSNVLAMITA